MIEISKVPNPKFLVLIVIIIVLNKGASSVGWSYVVKKYVLYAAFTFSGS
jgi:hypothetical protein